MSDTASILRAYRLIYTNYTYAPPQLWETEQPYIDNLSLSARTFGHRMKQRFFLFLNAEALNQENCRVWQTHDKPKPAHDHIADWLELLAKHWQVMSGMLESEASCCHQTETTSQSHSAAACTAIRAYPGRRP